MNIMFDTGAGIHMCPSWFGEHFPLASRMLKVTSVSGRNVGELHCRSPVGEQESPNVPPLAKFGTADAHKVGTS